MYPSQRHTTRRRGGRRTSIACGSFRRPPKNNAVKTKATLPRTHTVSTNGKARTGVGVEQKYIYYIYYIYYIHRLINYMVYSINYYTRH